MERSAGLGVGGSTVGDGSVKGMLFSFMEMYVLLFSFSTTVTIILENELQSRGEMERVMSRTVRPRPG